MQLELAVASCGCGGRAAGFAAGVGRCLSFSRAAAGLWATQLELAAASCGCGCQAAGDAAGVGRCLLRVRGQACGRRSWSWPLPLARAAAGLQATQLELAAASSACGGRAAGDAAGVGRCLLRVRRPGCGRRSWSWPLPLARAEVQLRELIAGRAGGVQLLSAQRAAAGRRAAARPSAAPAGGCSYAAAVRVAALARRVEVLLHGPWRRRSWRCPAAAGLACCCWEAG
jgi:hypothetical protein